MSDELLDALGDAFISLRIAEKRKGITFYQWAESNRTNPLVLQYIQLKGALILENRY